MIKINLLGTPKPKRGKAGRAAATQMVEMGGGGGGGNPILLIVIAVVLALGYVGYRYNAAQNEAARIAKETQAAEAENRRLAAVKAKYDQEQKVKENYERRVKVIDDLRQAQSGPVNLLTMISDTVNGTDAVWLNSMQDTGNQIRIDGTALSSTAVANLMKNLQKTGFFKSVEMSETAEDPASKDIQAFNFKLVCEKQKS
ncbi:MAG TPA: PilN domain-containing protein [Terriglobales bacterium]|nr:PilN domain-containing protein [Terriglobales bacterium]